MISSLNSFVRQNSGDFQGSATKWPAFIFPTSGALVAAGVSYFLYKAVQNRSRQKQLLGLIASKKEERKRQITELRKRLHSQDDRVERQRKEIVYSNFENLRAKLQNGQLTALEVLEAFQWKALQAQEQTNCVCEFLLEATEWAKQLDRQFSQAKKKPPLFGIPVSVKECNRLIGHDTTVGFAQFIGKSSNEDATLVSVLKALGAIPFVTTNLPQSMVSIGSSNPVYGITTNPHDGNRSSGGSSSGEGALIALHGSPLGIGTDIGGSVRAPAHWCGICSLKPSLGRLAQGGRMGVVHGQTSIKGTAGPMGGSVDSLVWFMRSVCDQVMYSMDPYAVPCPFNERLFTGDGRPLTIGYYDTDGWLKASPACKRAVEVARNLLEAKGHKLVKISYPLDREEMRQLLTTYACGIVPDGGQSVKSYCQNDIVDPFHTYLMDLLSEPNWRRRLRSRGTRSKRSAAIIGAFASSTAEQAAAFVRIDGYRQQFTRFWRSHNLDAVICPALATVAMPPDVASKLFVMLWSYCALYNLLDFPAGIVPCTYVTVADEQAAVKGDENDGEDEDDWVAQLLRSNSKGTAGLPVGVQCVALPFREEICLRVMKEIETGVKNNERVN